MAKKKASSTLYFIFFFIIFLAFCAFAVDGTIVLTNRAKLQNITEMTAMAAASEFNYDKDAAEAVIEQKVNDTATSTFGVLKQDSLKTAVIDPPNAHASVDGTGHYTSGTIPITTHMVAQPFFLSFLGVTGINLDAKATAKSEPKLVFETSDSSIHWVTKKATYSADAIVNDSVVLQSLNTNANASYVSGQVNWSNISSDIGAGQNTITHPTSAGTYPLSLGPGGFVTIKLPVPIIDKLGYDLYIEETGTALEGYMVFAGLDADPDKPYVDHTDTGSGLLWVNISCSGVPVNSGYTGVHNISSIGQADFYGSGYFDLSNSCLNDHVHMIKYIRIIDDNSESAYIKDNNGQYYQTMLYGESSTTTPGADIDYVQVLNYVHLQ